ASSEHHSVTEPVPPYSHIPSQQPPYAIHSHSRRFLEVSSMLDRSIRFASDGWIVLVPFPCTSVRVRQRFWIRCRLETRSWCRREWIGGRNEILGGIERLGRGWL